MSDNAVTRYWVEDLDDSQSVIYEFYKNDLTSKQKNCTEVVLATDYDALAKQLADEKKAALDWAAKCGAGEGGRGK